MKLYLSGPITGLPHFNKPAFAQAATELRAVGHYVVNPHDVCTILDEHTCHYPCTPSEDLLPWGDYLRADLVAMLVNAEALAMLPGWTNSRGAQLEVSVARALGWEVRDYTDWLNLQDIRTPVAL